MSNVPDGAQLSDDGQWWWDGAAWQPVNPADAGGSGGGAAPDAAADVTPEELQQINDTGTEPGDEAALDDRLRGYFEPDFDSVPDDTSYAEQAETMDDSQFTNSNTNADANASNQADSDANANTSDGSN